MRKIKAVNEHKSRAFRFIIMFIQFVMNRSAASGKSEIRTSIFVIHFCHSIDFVHIISKRKENMLTKGKMTMSSCLSFIPYYPRTIFGGVFPCNAATKFSAAVIAICCLVFNVAIRCVVKSQRFVMIRADCLLNRLLCKRIDACCKDFLFS